MEHETYMALERIEAKVDLILAQARPDLVKKATKPKDPEIEEPTEDEQEVESEFDDDDEDEDIPAPPKPPKKKRTRLFGQKD